MMCLCGLVFQRVGVEHGDARRARVEVNAVAPIVDDRIAVVIIQIKFARCAFQCLLDKRSGNADDLVVWVEFSPARGKQIPRFRVLHLDAGTLQKLICFFQNPANELVA